MMNLKYIPLAFMAVFAILTSTAVSASRDDVCAGKSAILVFLGNITFFLDVELQKKECSFDREIETSTLLFKRLNCNAMQCC